MCVDLLCSSSLLFIFRKRDVITLSYVDSSSAEYKNIDRLERQVRDQLQFLDSRLCNEADKTKQSSSML
jgi:hypothetical protein